MPLTDVANYVPNGLLSENSRLLWTGGQFFYYTVVIRYNLLVGAVVFDDLGYFWMVVEKTVFAMC